MRHIKQDIMIHHWTTVMMHDSKDKHLAFQELFIQSFTVLFTVGIFAKIHAFFQFGGCLKTEHKAGH